MHFVLPIISIILLFIFNVICYIMTFSSDFALKNKDVYDIISIFNDFIFITCCLVSFKLLKKAKFTGTVITLCIPLFYSILLWHFFR